MFGNRNCTSVQATYTTNYDRLRQVKTKYDPDNFSHVNQNIEPTS